MWGGRFLATVLKVEISISDSLFSHSWLGTIPTNIYIIPQWRRFCTTLQQKVAFFFTSAHAKLNLSAREGEFSFSRVAEFSTFFLLLCSFLCTCARGRAKPQATPAQGDLNLLNGENKKGSLRHRQVYLSRTETGGGIDTCLALRGEIGVRECKLVLLEGFWVLKGVMPGVPRGPRAELDWVLLRS